MSSHLFVPGLHTLHSAGKQLLVTELARAQEEGVLCPPADLIFRAFNSFPLNYTRVVILGQDPYHVRGKANGLAFGYGKDYPAAPNSSLANIIKEVCDSTGEVVEDYSLASWAEQGVLLINTRLTTTTAGPLMHKGMGWEDLIGHFLERLGDSIGPHVYMLWGREAQSYKKYINDSYNLVLTASHPCSYSANRGFIGCNHFAEANQWLRENDKGEIQWGR